MQQDKIQFAITYGTSSIKTQGQLVECGVEQALDFIRDVAFGVTVIEGTQAGFYNVCEIVFEKIWGHTDCPKAKQIYLAFEELKYGDSTEHLDFLYEKHNDTFLVG